MRVLVCGGRTFRDRRLLWDYLDELDRTVVVDVIIEGEADGADKLARRWAENRGVPFHPFPAAWDDIDRPGAVIRTTKFGKKYDAAAGSIRNQRMLDEGCPDLVVACPGGTGTEDMIDRADKAGIPIEEL